MKLYDPTLNVKETARNKIKRNLASMNGVSKVYIRRGTFMSVYRG